MNPVVECVINDQNLQNHLYPYRGNIEEGAGIGRLRPCTPVREE